MGLLGRFSSLSRKSRTKSSEQPPLRPMVDPLKQDHVTLTSNVSNDATWVAPSTGSSLFDDIFMELGQSAQAAEMSFAQLDLGPAATYHTNECPPLADTTTHEPIKLSTTPTILDSDVSEDEDEEEDSDDSSDDENDTLGPILPRLDGAKAESMLDRMKDRHRQQVQALRQPHVFKSMMMHHSNARTPAPMIPATTPPQRTPVVRTQSMTFSSSSRRQGSVNSDDTGKKRPAPGLKSMSSESDLARLYHPPLHYHQPPVHYHQQMILQQQLRLEWERIQLYQHQLQHDYHQLQRSTTLPSFQPYYYPSFYPLHHH